MRRRSLLISSASTGLAFIAPNVTGARHQSTPLAEPESGYAAVNGLEMYYEIRGQGDPVVFIHGAFGSIEEWGSVPESIAANHQVVAMDLQGHGRTADVDRSFSYEQLADDVAALMNYLDIGEADVVGYSMGANTALQIAIRNPELVRNLVLVFAIFRTDGEYPEVVAGISALAPDMLAGSPIEALYASVAPNPDDFPMLVEKLKTFFTTEFAFPEADIAAIASPALVMVGDSDTVLPEHAIELFRLLGGGVPGDMVGLPESQLAILPATTHASILYERGDVLTTMIGAFLS